MVDWETMFSWRVRTGGPEGRELRGDEKKLYMQVRRKLWEYEPLRASHAEMMIEVDGDRVRLSGRVRTLPQKLIAGLLASRIEGVGSLENHLVADPEVTRDVADRLARDPRTAPYVIQVESRHGTAILRGDVPDTATRQAAVQVASGAESVVAVRSELQIGGPRYEAVALSTAREALPSGQAER